MYTQQDNSHLINILGKECVRRAISAIRTERLRFEAFAKEGYGGGADVVTSADLKAQEVYLKLLRECTPDYGIIAEENNLAIPSKHPDGRSWTLDPADGTRALTRKQSHGIATMLALRDNSGFLGGWIGDINTQEVYYTRPSSSKIHRITNYETGEKLEWQAPPNHKKGYLLLRDPLISHSFRDNAEKALVRATVLNEFDAHESMGSSIGTWFARLWKGEVTACLLPPNHSTPWDDTPVIGISQKMGFVFLQPVKVEAEYQWEEYEPILPMEVTHRDHPTFVVHESMKDRFVS